MIIDESCVFLRSYVVIILDNLDYHMHAINCSNKK